MKLFGRLLYGFGVLLILSVLLVSIPCSVPRFFGYEIYNITSGSMEPYIPAGSLVYVKPLESVSSENPAVGDIIAFYDTVDGESVITHRVAENHPEEQEIVTKGDANEGNDFIPIPYSHIIGTVQLRLPYLGFFGAVFSTAEGKLCLSGFLAAGLLFCLLGRRLQPKEKAR